MTKSKLDYPQIPTGEFRTLDCCVMALYERTSLMYEMNTLMTELYRHIPGYEEHVKELAELLSDK